MPHLVVHIFHCICQINPDPCFKIREAALFTEHKEVRRICILHLFRSVASSDYHNVLPPSIIAICHHLSHCTFNHLYHTFRSVIWLWAVRSSRLVKKFRKQKTFSIKPPMQMSGCCRHRLCEDFQIDQQFCNWGTQQQFWMYETTSTTQWTRSLGVERRQICKHDYVRWPVTAPKSIQRTCERGQKLFEYPE